MAKSKFVPFLNMLHNPHFYFLQNTIYFIILSSSLQIIQGDSVARGPKLLSMCGTQANASHWTSPIYRGGSP